MKPRRTTAQAQGKRRGPVEPSQKAGAPSRKSTSSTSTERKGPSKKWSSPEKKSQESPFRKPLGEWGGERRERPKKKTHSLEENKPIRLNRLIAEAGVASRRAADELIAEGKVKVNGKVVKELGTRVSGADAVTVNGDPIRRSIRYRYVLLNKPKDTITTTKDEHGRKTVLDLINGDERLFPVGRLDRNTTGVLLLTNDGDLAHRMTHPSYGVERVYRVKLDKPIDLRDARKVSEGVSIGRGEQTSPCQISVDSSDRTDLTVTLREGKNREIRRMFESVGYAVSRLNRVSYAGLTTRGLSRGEWRELKKGEVRELRKKLKLEI